MEPLGYQASEVLPLQSLSWCDDQTLHNGCHEFYFPSLSALASLACHIHANDKDTCHLVGLTQPLALR